MRYWIFLLLSFCLFAQQPVPTGTTTFYDGETPIGTITMVNGIATFTTSTLTVGTHTITAVYSGDSNYNGSTSSALMQVVTPPIPVFIISQTGVVNTPFSYQIATTNTPLSYSAVGLPPGLSVNSSTGLISGTPTSTGSSNITLNATNSGGTGVAILMLNITSPVVVQPPVITLQPTNVSVQSGDPATVFLSAIGATSFQWQSEASNASVFTNIVGATNNFYNLPAANSPNNGTKFQCVVSNSGGSVTSQVATLTVSTSVNPPVINSFTANPSSINSGQSSTLSWNVTGATSISISGIGTVTGNSVSVSPTTTTTYTLTATNSAGSPTSQTTVIVNAVVNPPVINSFTANPTSINQGQSSTLSWNVTGALTISISGIGVVTGTSISVSPSATTTYTLTATNSAGSPTAQTTVTVNSVVVNPPVINSFSAALPTINLGQFTNLSWSVTGATTISISGIGTVTGNSIAVSPTTTTTYTLTASNSAGSPTAQTTVTVVNPPVINSFSVSPNVITQGQSATLSWSVTGATTITISGLGTVTGNSLSVSPISTTVYTLTATNSAGSPTAQTTLTVNPVVVNPPVINSFNVSPNVITQGQSSTLSWNVTGANTINISGIGTVTGNSISVSPSSTTTYTLTATNSAGSPTAQTTLTVNPVVVNPPVINSFAANPTSITSGQSSILSWNVTGATSISISGIGTVTGTSITVTPGTTTTYVLTASNSGGNPTASTIVSVTPIITTTPTITFVPATVKKGSSFVITGVNFSTTRNIVWITPASGPVFGYTVISTNGTTLTISTSSNSFSTTGTYSFYVNNSNGNSNQVSILVQ